MKYAGKAPGARLSKKAGMSARKLSPRPGVKMGLMQKAQERSARNGRANDAMRDMMRKGGMRAIPQPGMRRAMPLPKGPQAVRPLSRPGTMKGRRMPAKRLR